MLNNMCGDDPITQAEACGYELAATSLRLQACGHMLTTRKSLTSLNYSSSLEADKSSSETCCFLAE